MGPLRSTCHSMVANEWINTSCFHDDNISVLQVGFDRVVLMTMIQLRSDYKKTKQFTL